MAIGERGQGFSAQGHLGHSRRDATSAFGEAVTGDDLVPHAQALLLVAVDLVGALGGHVLEAEEIGQ